MSRYHVNHLICISLIFVIVLYARFSPLVHCVLFFPVFLFINNEQEVQHSPRAYKQHVANEPNRPISFYPLPHHRGYDDYLKHSAFVKRCSRGWPFVVNAFGGGIIYALGSRAGMPEIIVEECVNKRLGLFSLSFTPEEEKKTTWRR